MRILFPALAICLVLAACDSPEERAEAHYQSALALLEEGDVDRALVELRSVFDDNGFHKEARQLYADTVLARGQIREAYGQYLRLIEQYPDTLPVRIRLATMALNSGNWEEFERHGTAAEELAPEDPDVQSIRAAIDYRTGTLEEDDALRDGAGERARALLQATPEDGISRRIVIDWLFNGPDPAAAMPYIEDAIAADAQDLQMQALKLALLFQLEDEAGVEAQLIAMSEVFPENEDVRQDLITWYMSQGNLDGAEGVLRDLAGPADSDTAGNTTLVRFLSEARGSEAARAELERLSAAAGEAPAADLWQALIAEFDFREGAQGDGIARIQGVLETAEPSDQTRQIRVMLARMMIATGNAVGAREQVETVLEEDASNVSALKIRADWAIDEDRTDDAINDLRTALSQAPRDPDVLTLMARAHERAGNAELAGERLATAVEISNNAPAESIRYARFLMAQDRASVARTVITEALRRSPGDLPLIRLAADLAIAASDFGELRALIARLEQIPGEEPERLARELQAATLITENRLEETAVLLEREIAQGGDQAQRATQMLVLARLRGGDREAARQIIDEALAADPDAQALRLLRADLSMVEGAPEAAEADLREILAREPASDMVVSRLHALLLSQGQPEAADEVLQAGIEAAPGSSQLKMLEASRLEAAGELEAAIAIYEALYDRDSSNVVIANNYASLLASYTEDPETLERAAVIARRLRGREVPPFQDTYGWIEYRRGNLEEALPNLEAAARGLPNDPLVQYHYGLAARDAGWIEAARAALEAAVRLGEGRDLPQIEAAGEALEALPAE